MTVVSDYLHASTSSTPSAHAGRGQNVPAGKTGIIGETGTTPDADTTVIVVILNCAKRFGRHYCSGSPALLHRHYRGTSTAVSHITRTHACALHARTHTPKSHDKVDWYIR